MNKINIQLNYDHKLVVKIFMIIKLCIYDHKIMYI